MVKGYRYFLVRKWRFLLGNIEHMRKHLDWLEEQIMVNPERYFSQLYTIKVSKLMLDILEKTFKRFKEIW